MEVLYNTPLLWRFFSIRDITEQMNSNFLKEVFINWSYTLLKDASIKLPYFE